ncbi:unnamed protein product, partial [Brassica oleracea var. botrytis]
SISFIVYLVFLLDRITGESRNNMMWRDRVKAWNSHRPHEVVSSHGKIGEA